MQCTYLVFSVNSNEKKHIRRNAYAHRSKLVLYLTQPLMNSNSNHPLPIYLLKSKVQSDLEVTGYSYIISRDLPYEIPRVLVLAKTYT